ncbi:beta-glucosidase [Colletotrichum orchidophilum]|uniref:beta-glucosidase n=1 Tax=Colletotrichum orchidophilum TaxID=1209926 RepID=A0A1G4AQB2_9PEZI|nr:beta-glucosidase [Colletotrichum orchidophilum]OHE91296.1 beta-glucosidase [Colletotrichum orchidophilum]
MGPQVWDDFINLKASISNRDTRAAFAVPQLYLSFPGRAPEGTPKKVLKGSKMGQIDAGSSAEMEVGLMRRELSSWDASDKVRTIPKGEFTFRVGSRLEDLPAEKVSSVLRGRLRTAR